MNETRATDTSQDDSLDVVALLRRQHGELRALMADIAQATPSSRPLAFDPFVRLMAVHETAEEMVVYPALGQCGPGAERVVELRKVEEDAGKKMLAHLEELGTDSIDFLPTFSELRIAVEQHALAEEQEVFPLLMAHLDADELQRLAAGVQFAESIAPTHAHAAAPEDAAGNFVVGPFISVMDRVRDALSDRAR